jgi:AcrR family transcriptional regulator
MGRTGSSRSTPRKEAYHHGDLRQALLDATLRLVDQHGPQGFTLRAAARAAGVTPSATYHHFEDKDALLAAVAEEGFELFRVVLEEAAKRPAPSARERSRNVGVAYVLFAVKHPTRFRVMVGFGVQARMRRGRLAPNAIATYQLVRNVLVEGLRRIPDEDISEAEVLGWWSVVHGLAFLAIDGHLGDVGKSPHLADSVVREVIRALDARRQS